MLAKAGKDSGMNDYIGGKLNYFSGLNPILLILVVMIFVKFLTEFITNIAVASLTLPILAAMVMIVMMMNLSHIYGFYFFRVVKR